LQFRPQRIARLWPRMERDKHFGALLLRFVALLLARSVMRFII
jgi:hypothetical protein